MTPITKKPEITQPHVQPTHVQPTQVQPTQSLPDNPTLLAHCLPVLLKTLQLPTNTKPSKPVRILINRVIGGFVGYGGQDSTSVLTNPIGSYNSTELL